MNIALWSIWAHLFVPLFGAIAFAALVGAIVYCLIKIRLRRETEVQRLKTQIDGLYQELRSILTTASTSTVELAGPGPFELPLISQFNWLIPDEENRVIGGFRSDDGKCLYVPVSYRAVAQFINDHRSAPLSKEGLSPTTFVSLTKRADAYVLPILPRFEGHRQRNSNVRILIFSSEDGRKIMLPISFEAYEKLLAESKAVLSYQEKKQLDALSRRQQPNFPALSRR